MLILLTLDAAPAPSVDRQLRLLRRRLPGVQVGLAPWPPGSGDAATPADTRGADFVANGMVAVMTAAFGQPVRGSD